MLNEHHIAAILDKMTYKPGTEFIMRERYSFTGDVDVQISIKVRDSFPPHAMTTLNGIEGFKKHELERMDIEEFKQRIYQRLVTMETHEVQEFFRYKGAHVVDPHPEQAAYRRAAADYAAMMNRHLEASMQPVGKPAEGEMRYTRKRYGKPEMIMGFDPGRLDAMAIMKVIDHGDGVFEMVALDYKDLVPEPELKAPPAFPTADRKGYSSKPYEAVRPRTRRRR